MSCFWVCSKCICNTYKCNWICHLCFHLCLWAYSIHPLHFLKFKLTNKETNPTDLWLEHVPATSFIQIKYTLIFFSPPIKKHHHMIKATSRYTATRFVCRRDSSWNFSTSSSPFCSAPSKAQTSRCEKPDLQSSWN